MKTSGNTILISGGTAGIGLEMAKLLSKDNKVIITGRDESRLRKALAILPGVTGIQSDISDNNQADELAERLKSEFPKLNIVINNAGLAFLHDLSVPGTAYQFAKDIMVTNYLSIVRFNDLLLPLLTKQHEAAIVNVSSIVAFAGSTNLSTYSASKAALHSYTQLLRLSLKDTSVKVFELMPPLVNTEFSKEIGGERGIAPETVAGHLLEAFASDTYEIRSGDTEHVYRLYLSSPDKALELMNQPQEQAQA
ncbi:MAG: SDR family NAD(P)-dependent oxidoreductase [Chitinophagaceae bacterium]